MNMLQEIEAYLLDKVRMTTLFEMALSRDEAWKKCNGLVDTLTEHLLKVMIMPTSTYVPHWKDEIHSYLLKLVIIRLKPKNKRLTTETYREWLIEQPDYDERSLNRWVEFIKKKYPKEKIEVPTTLVQDYRRVMEKICVDLGNDVVTEL